MKAQRNIGGTESESLTAVEYYSFDEVGDEAGLYAHEHPFQPGQLEDTQIEGSTVNARRWDLSINLRAGEHILMIEVIPQFDGQQQILFFTDQNDQIPMIVKECAPNSKMRSIQADEGFELCDIEWKEGTVHAIQKPIDYVQEDSSCGTWERLYSNQSESAAEDEEEEVFPAEIEIAEANANANSEPLKKSGGKGKLSNIGRAGSSYWKPGIQLEAYFEKRGGGTYSSDWKRRYFVLNPAREILYYTDDSCKVAKGEFHLTHNAQLKPMGKFLLNIICSDRTWEFRFNTTEVRDEWVEGITKVMASDNWGYCGARGLLKKKGKRFGAWKVKYFKLYENMVWKHFNDENSCIVHKESHLKNIVKYQITKFKDDDWQWGFDLHLKGGAVRSFRCRSLGERIMWIGPISRFLNKTSTSAVDLIN